MRSLRPFAALCAACFLAGCGSDQASRSQSQAASPAPANTPPARRASIDPPVQLLLAASAKDFHAHQPPYPARFRDVRVGRTVAPDGTEQYVLSGQFLPTQGKGKPDWTPFATIKTSDYEQLLGAQATGYCEQPSIIWENREDLSSSLQGQLDSLR
jgi:hypothetical protein